MLVFITISFSLFACWPPLIRYFKTSAFQSVNHFCPQDVPFPSSSHLGELSIQFIQWHITVLFFHLSSSTSCLLGGGKPLQDCYLNRKYWAKWHSCLLPLNSRCMPHLMQWGLTFKLNGDCSTVKPLDTYRVRFDKEQTVPGLNPLIFLCPNNSEFPSERH